MHISRKVLVAGSECWRTSSRQRVGVRVLVAASQGTSSSLVLKVLVAESVGLQLRVSVLVLA
jgi:hypothetical protein